jgi:hypothetical protein
VYGTLLDQALAPPLRLLHVQFSFCPQLSRLFIELLLDFICALRDVLG